MSKESPNELKIINKNERLKYRLIINELRQQLKENDKLLKCYQEEEKLIADILGDKDLTIIGSRVHLKNLIVELKNKIKDRDIVIEEKDKEIERLKKNHRISYTNQKKAYEKLKNSANTKSLIKYPKKLDGCLIKDEKDLFDYAKESTRDIKYLRNERTQLAIQELEKVKIMAENLLEKFCSSWEYHQKYMRGHRHIEYYDLIQGIDNQIKELKGE